jgi:hypothetical protein
MLSLSEPVQPPKTLNGRCIKFRFYRRRLAGIIGVEIFLCWGDRVSFHVFSRKSWRWIQFGGMPRQAAVFLAHTASPRITYHFLRLKAETRGLLGSYLHMHTGANHSRAGNHIADFGVSPCDEEKTLPIRFWTQAREHDLGRGKGLAGALCQSRRGGRDAKHPRSQGAYETAVGHATSNSTVHNLLARAPSWFI